MVQHQLWKRSLECCLAGFRGGRVPQVEKSQVHTRITDQDQTFVGYVVASTKIETSQLLAASCDAAHANVRNFAARLKTETFHLSAAL
jgi:hypothetical protein